ncbi:MalY/PatB family protein [Deinococcus lacus]|uniref:cysteine-S-conjugate beta-lyase n=1 Tax=Deinococcus lacus TaxID=392561 RepID=A0ABW1YBD1_9DEIO
MSHPFDTLQQEQLRHADSLKWTTHPADILPLWIADMDFPPSEALLAALKARLDRGIGYYHAADPALRAQLQAVLAGRGMQDVPADGILFLPSVVPGLYAAVAALTQPGEDVLSVLPIYPPFHQAILEQGRHIQGVALREGPERWELDWEALEAAVTPRTRLLMLCHPHNPTGRVWTSEELGRLREFAVRHDLYVCSDELHADLIYAGSPAFESFAADPAVAGRTVTLIGPCKTYNVAGLSIGALVSHDPALAQRVRSVAGGLMGHPSALSVTSWQVALREGGEWLAETLAYLQANRDYVADFVAARLPGAQMHSPEATYLAWINLGPERKQAGEWLLREAKVALNAGPLFMPANQAPEWDSFVRLNFATSRSILTEALERVERALR